MKLIILCSFILFSALSYGRSTHVKGYSKRNGYYVQPHYKTTPNHIKQDNYSHKGNINPYTGKKGYKN